MGWARARRVDESLRQRSSGSNNHKTPAGAAAAPQAKRTLPSNHASFTLTAHAARTRHRSSSTCPLPRSLALSRSSVSGASHLHLQRRSSSSITEKKREFLSFIRRFPRNPHSPPHPPALRFLYMYIYFCRVEEEKILFFV